jgi:hypothetical protein
MSYETMRKGCIALAAVCLIAAPSHAGNWQDMVQSDFHNSTAAVRPGAFAGARFVTSFGRHHSSRGQISLAPTHSHISGNGSVKTLVGEGLAVNFSVKSKPSLTLAGARADVLLGLNQRGSVDGDKKLGMSTGGWVAVGLVTAALVGYVAFAAYVSEKEKGAD